MIDPERLVDIIEQAIFETDTGLEAALLASERIAAEYPDLIRGESGSPPHCDHGMSAHGDDGCIHCDCKVPGFRSRGESGSPPLESDEAAAIRWLAANDLYAVTHLHDAPDCAECFAGESGSPTSPGEER